MPKISSIIIIHVNYVSNKKNTLMREIVHETQNLVRHNLLYTTHLRHTLDSHEIIVKSLDVVMYAWVSLLPQ